MFIGLYLSAMMMFFQIRQYLFTGTYEPGLVNADVQNIYAVIKYAPFDEKILRKENQNQPISLQKLYASFKP